MEVRIGIQQTAREIVFESDEKAAELQKTIAEGFKSEQDLLSFTDNKGKIILIPKATIAFVEIGVEENRKIGFVP